MLACRTCIVRRIAALSALTRKPLSRPKSFCMALAAGLTWSIAARLMAAIASHACAALGRLPECLSEAPDPRRPDQALPGSSSMPSTMPVVALLDRGQARMSEGRSTSADRCAQDMSAQRRQRRARCDAGSIVAESQLSFAVCLGAIPLCYRPHRSTRRLGRLDDRRSSRLRAILSYDDGDLTPRHGVGPTP